MYDTQMHIHFLNFDDLWLTCPHPIILYGNLDIKGLPAHFITLLVKGHLFVQLVLFWLIQRAKQAD